MQAVQDVYQPVSPSVTSVPKATPDQTLPEAEAIPEAKPQTKPEVKPDMPPLVKSSDLAGTQPTVNNTPAASATTQPDLSNIDTPASTPVDGMTPALALQKVQTPQTLPTKPIDAARSFHIQPDGTVVDNNRAPLVPTAQPTQRSFWRQHAAALAGGAVGSVAAVKLHHTLKPVNLNRLQWQANTHWPELNNLVNTVSQPVIKGIRENGLLNSGLAWAKTTMCLTPVMTAALWGEQQQRRWQKKHQPHPPDSAEL